MSPQAPPPDSFEILIADYANPEHARDLVALLDSYARDPMGGGAPLPRAVREGLPAALAGQPQAFSLLGYADGRPAALANCFRGLSTFQCRPLINIHDLAVAPDWRGRGLGLRMLAEVEALARAEGCCKITLEVLEGNRVAQGAYRRAGFAPYELDPGQGRALFWQKKL